MTLLIMEMLTLEHMAQMGADDSRKRHVETARATRRAERDAELTKPSAPKPYLSFLPRLVGYPYGR